MGEGGKKSLYEKGKRKKRREIGHREGRGKKEEESHFGDTLPERK